MLFYWILMPLLFFPVKYRKNIFFKKYSVNHIFFLLLSVLMEIHHALTARSWCNSFVASIDTTAERSSKMEVNAQIIQKQIKQKQKRHTNTQTSTKTR